MTNAAPASLETEVWDLSSYFPGLDTDAYRTFFAETERQIAGLEARGTALPPLRTDNVAKWADYIVCMEQLLPRLSHLNSYIGCLTAADARDEKAELEDGRVTLLGSKFEKLDIVLKGALRDADDATFAALVSLPALSEVAHRLNLFRWEARHSMPVEQERLASDLAVDGLTAWDRLYSKIAGKLEFEFTNDKGERERRPMAHKVSLLDNPSPAVRKSVFDGSNAAWGGVEHVVASALNHISGTRLTLYRRRGIPHFLDQALFDSGITRRTLDALFGAIEETVDIPRRALRLKGRALGLATIGFQDITASLPRKDARKLAWAEARGHVIDAFAPYPRLHEYATTAFRNRWVESEQRNGKRPGAFCTSSYHIRESRVFMSFGGRLNDALTLAHELGHAFHNEVMKDLRPFRRSYPMTLAETASTFCEALMVDRMLADTTLSREARASILDTQLVRAIAFLLDIPFRYYFERDLYERRANGELSVSELKDMMLAAQKRSFGDVIAHGDLDPMFWASKLHFYITGVSFYNFPYTFGYLFSRALNQAYRREGSAFLPKYEKMLLMTGSAPAEVVVRESLGQDIETIAFWKDAIVSHEADIAEYEKLISGK